MFGSDENKPIGNVDWLEEDGLSLNDWVPCDDEGCGVRAMYWTRVGCCGYVRMFCGGHMHALVKMLLFFANNDKTAVCWSCREENRPEGWISHPEKISLLD